MILNIIYDGEEHKVWNSELKKYGKQEEHTKKNKCWTHCPNSAIIQKTIEVII